MGRDSRYMGGMGCGFASYSALQTDSSRCGEQLGDANEIVSGSSEDEEPFHQAAPTMPGLAETADGLHPAKGFLDPLALDRADPIAGMAGRARVDRGAAIGIVLRYMRRTAAFAAAGDKVGGVIVLVAAHGAARPGIVLDHIERGRALRCALASVNRASTMRPLRFSVIRCPMWQSLASLPAPLRNKRASGSVVEKCVSFLRFSPWKSRSALRPPLP